ncbi:MAG: LAGLIDADG family homing endonuclease, partial [Candidatus Gastranaerophilaceae bacterium]
ETVSNLFWKFPGIQECCLLPNTEIILNNGTKKIENIVDGDMVVTHKGNVEKVLATSCRKYEGNIVEILAQESKISMTEDHKVPVIEVKRCNRNSKNYCLPNCGFSCRNNSTFRNYSILWKEAKNIVPKNDFAILPIDEEIKDIAELKIGHYNDILDKNSCAVKLPETVKINSNFLYFAGLYLSEGHASCSYNRTGFSFHIKESLSLAGPLIDIIKKEFGLKATLYKKPKNNTCIVVVNSKAFSNMCIDLFGKYSYGKKIPDFLMKLSPERQKFLVRSMFKGDGSYLKPRKTGFDNVYNDNGRVTYATISPYFAYQIRMILYRIGIFSSLKIKPAIGIHKIAYFIMIYGKQAQWLKTMVWDHPDKYCKEVYNNAPNCFLTIDNVKYALVPIRKTTVSHYEGNVYNFNVNNDHSYTTLAFSVKNCFCGFAEVLMHPELQSIINFCKDGKAYPAKFVGVISNGSYLTEKLPDLIKAPYRPNYISVSINGYDQESHSQNTGTKDLWDKVVEGIKMLAKSNITCYVSYICTKEKIKHVGKVLNLLASIDPKITLHLHNLLPHSKDLTWFKENVLTEENDLDTIKSLKGLPNANMIGILPTPISFDESKQSNRCNSFWNLVNIDGNGHVGGCCSVFAPCKENGHILDSILWFNEYFESNRKAIAENAMSPQCRYCFRNFSNWSMAL